MKSTRLASFLSILAFGIAAYADPIPASHRVGGFAIGCERLTMQLLNLANIREASLFPRDVDRMTP